MPRALLASAVVAALLAGCSGEPPNARGGPIAMRRLTADQYRQAIADAFGPDIEIAGRFEPDNRSEGLNAVGSSRVTVTPSGFEQYEAIGNYIASQVVSKAHRERVAGCRPASETAADRTCTEQVVRRVGRQLLRRPLRENEIELRVIAANEIAAEMQSFNAGLELALTSLLVAPDFLFRIEVGEPDGEDPSLLRLSDFTLASRLSYLLWNRGPDEALLAAAERGELSDTEGLAREVDRMLASDRVGDGARAFFEDLFLFDQFENLGKDVTRYPLFTSRVAADAREQTLRFVVDHLVTRGAGYPELFTSRSIPITMTLGPVYGLPVRSPNGWSEARFPPDAARSGLLSHASLNMLHSHPGRSSPTLRGVFLREALLCQSVPEAPADVEFALFNEDDNPEYRTARDRLGAHATEASCRNCHKLSDPIGLGLEVFDGIGRYRTTENGAPIDTSGDLDGDDFSNPVELGEAFAASPLIGPCLVQNLYRYAVGRLQGNDERRLLRQLEGRFAASDHKLRPLLRAIALSDGFRTATLPEAETAEAGEST